MIFITISKSASLWTSIFLLLFIANVQAQEQLGGCIDPEITAIDGPGSICSGDSATLTVTHDGEEINWYDAETGGNLLGTGNPFDTGALATTTSFWAESTTVGTGAPILGGARVAPTNTSNSEVVPVTSPWGLAFNADVSFTINEVDVYIADDAPGSVVVQLKDSDLNIIEEATIATPAGNSTNPVQFALALDFFVPAGTDYNLVAASSPEMVREFSSGHPGFPYPIGTAGTVTGGTINDNDTNATVYYFFYNWNVTPTEICTSDRVLEEVEVITAGLPDGDSNQEFTTGETLADLDVTGTDLTWYSDAGGNTEIPDSTLLIDGTTYYVSQTISGCESDLLAITVSEILGLTDTAFSGLSYVPNPVFDELVISNKIPIQNITMYNIQGQQLSNVAQRQPLSEVRLDLSSYPVGTYFVRLKANETTTVIKIVKQ